MNASPPGLAVVTGASRGLGRDMARVLGERGWELFLVARDGEALSALAGEMESAHGVRARTTSADLATSGGVEATLAALEGRVPDLLINNAGIGIIGPYLETDPARELALVRLNVEALVRLTRAVLPGMVARGSGRVLNVGSTAGFLPGPLMSTYYASKAFVLSWSDGLDEELRGTGVGVTCLCPGPTRTGFQAEAGAKRHGALRVGAMDSASVARAGVEGALAGRRRVVPGLFNKLSITAPRLLPRDVLTAIVARIQRGRL